MNGIFITGTDTGVGKTYIATGIARTFRSNGIDVGVMKPAETGCRVRQGDLRPKDAISLIEAAGVSDSLDLVNPYRYRKPLAPLAAAAMEGQKIFINRIKSAYQELSRKHEFMIVEGAGGIMVPLTLRYSYLDLASDLGLPVLVVARPNLGTINHTLLTIMAIQQRNISLAGIVFNKCSKEQRDLAERTSPAVIEQLSGVRVLGSISFGQQNFKRLILQLGECQQPFHRTL